MGIGLGAIAGGIRQGLSDYRENMRAIDNDERRKKADERDDERYAFEKKQRASEEAKIKAREEFTKTIEQINSNRAAGTGGFEQYGFRGQPQGAIPAPGQEQPQANPFKIPGDGMYQNQRAADKLAYDMRAQALETLFTKLGEPEKAMMAREQMAGLFEKDVERKTKAAIAAAASGAPGAIGALSNVYSYITDGVEIDPNSGKWDPKAMKYTDVVFKDTKSGKTVKGEITQEQLLAAAKVDPAQLTMFNIGNMWKSKDFELKDRATKADEKRADAAVTSAGASVTAAGAQVKRANIAEQGLEFERRASEQNAKVQAIQRQFPLATKEFKPEELMLEKDQGKGRLAEKERQGAMMDKALDLAGLNPKVDVNLITRVVRQGKVQAQRDAEGRAFTMVGSTKLYLE